MEEQTKHQQDDKLMFQYFLVIFLDILGQSQKLRGIKDLPTNDSQKDEFIKKLQTTFGKVYELRKAFEDYFAAVDSYSPDLALIPPEYLEKFSLSHKSEAYFYGFSDSIIMAIPLKSENENCTALNGVFCAFAATCGIGLMALAKNFAIRGGIDVGIAAQIEGKEIYGPALERAHFLESNLAEYPRFLVGKELFNYLQWVLNQQCKTFPGKIGKNIAKFCLEMLTIDTDGRLILDFMGDRARETADGSINADVIKSVHQFVFDQYREYIEKNDEKLSSRYFRLLRYIDSHAEHWGVKITSIPVGPDKSD